MSRCRLPAGVLCPAKGELDLLDPGTDGIIGGVQVDGDIRVVPAVGIRQGEWSGGGCGRHVVRSYYQRSGEAEGLELGSGVVPTIANVI